MSGPVIERVRGDGVVQRQSAVGSFRLGAGLGWAWDVDDVPLLTLGSLDQLDPEAEPVHFVELSFDNPIEYANLPDVGGTWTFGADEVLTLEGQLRTSASTATRAGLIAPHGTAPAGAGLIDGALWSTTAGWFVRTNGVTQQLAAGIIGPTQGGTGLSSYATGDIIYASAANTLAKLAASATASGPILRQASGIPSWTTAIYPDTVVAGRLLYGSATNVVGALTLGASGTVLTSNGSAPVWGTVPYGGMPSGSGTWDPGLGNIITISRQINLPETIVNSGAFLRIPYRADPAGPTNGDIWINSTTGELKWRALGVTHAVS